MDDDFESVDERPKLLASGGIQAIARFEPGNLLGADDINELVDAIKELDRRLSRLEEA